MCIAILKAECCVKLVNLGTINIKGPEFQESSSFGDCEFVVGHCLVRERVVFLSFSFLGSLLLIIVHCSTSSQVGNS